HRCQRRVRADSHGEQLRGPYFHVGRNLPVTCQKPHCAIREFRSRSYHAEAEQLPDVSPRTAAAPFPAVAWYGDAIRSRILAPRIADAVTVTVIGVHGHTAA